MDEEVKLAIHKARDDTRQARCALDFARKRYHAVLDLCKDIELENSDGLCELKAAGQAYFLASNAYAAALRKWAKLLIDYRPRL